MILDKLNTYEARFIDENAEAVAIVRSIFDGVLHDFEVINEAAYDLKKNGDKSFENFVMELKDDVSPNILKEFLSMDIYQVCHILSAIHSRLREASRYVNVYGTPKYGDLGRDKDDILNSLQHSLVFGDENEVGFNVESNLAVFIYDRDTEIFPKEEIKVYDIEESCIIALDVNAAFIRLLASKDKFGIEFEALKKDIRMAIFSKIIAYGFSMRAIVHMLRDKFKEGGYFSDMNIYRLLELTFARWAYSTVNNLTAYQEYGVSLDSLIDYVKAQAEVDIPAKGVMNVVNLGMAKLRGKEYLMRRSIDKYIEHCKEQYSNDYVTITQNPYASNMPMRTHRRIKLYKNSEHNYGESFPERLVAAYESWNYQGDKAAAFNFFGIEALLKPTDPKFAEFRRKERQEIMAKLTFTERKRYTDLENDFIILKASVTNANTVDAQRVLLKRCGMLRDVINLELERTNNEYLATLFYGLDSDIFSLQSDLSDRNIFKERNTRLYGQLKTTNKWDY